MEENIIASDFEDNQTQPAIGILRPIVYAGLTVGVLDAIAATLNTVLRGGNPFRVFQYVASGVLGPSAFEGGLATYALGLLFHFTIAFGASIVFITASRFLSFLGRTSPFLIGPIYGVIVYFVMREIVTPLSLVSKPPSTVSGTVIMIIIHMICVGLPIALITSKFAKERE